MPNEKKKTLSRATIVYITAITVIVIMMTFIGVSVFLRVTNIKVEGISKYTRQEIIEASGVSIGDSLIFADLQSIAQRIREQLPFVNDAEFIREYPDTLLINITESAAIATIAFAGEILIIDSSGRVLKIDNNKPEDLIEVRGVEINDVTVGAIPKSELGAEMKFQYMQDVLVAIEREGLERDISYLDVSNITNIHFGFSGIYRVILGGPSNVRNKLSRLHEDLIQLETRYPGTPGDINMSSPSGDVSFTPTQ